MQARFCNQYVDLPRTKRHLLPQIFNRIAYYKGFVNSKCQAALVQHAQISFSCVRKESYYCLAFVFGSFGKSYCRIYGCSACYPCEQSLVLRKGFHSSHSLICGNSYYLIIDIRIKHLRYKVCAYALQSVSGTAFPCESSGES